MWGRSDRDRFGYPGRRVSGLGFWLKGLIFGAAAGYLCLFAWAGHLVSEAQILFRDGKLIDAHARLSRAAWWHARNGRVQDALGVVDLAAGNLAEGQVHLARARSGFFHPAAFGDDQVLAGFLRAGQYEPARIYAAHRLGITSTPKIQFYLGAAELAENKLDEADHHLADATKDPALAGRAAALRLTIESRRRTHRADEIMDRHAMALVATDIVTGKALQLAPDLAPLLSSARGLSLEAADPGAMVTLTLDLEMQRAAEAALSTQRGGLVVLDVATGGLLAAASQPAGSPAPAALRASCEPGSIIKMITLSAALRKGINVEGQFPMECPGVVVIDKTPYRDWMTHRQVGSVDEAVAVSCNIAFSRLAAMVGRDALDAELRHYGFGGAGSMPESDLIFDGGELTAPDAARPGFALARRAVGLDSITITAIHAAVLATGLARGGVAPVPYIIEKRQNILGEAIDVHQPKAIDPAALSPEAAALIVRVMKAAVAGAGHGDATGRRAAVDGLTIALKTGTSGANPPGLDAIVIGFAPADRPVIAWGLVAQGAGKAEFEGARITREFLSRVKDRLH